MCTASERDYYSMQKADTQKHNIMNSDVRRLWMRLLEEIRHGLFWLTITNVSVSIYFVQFLCLLIFSFCQRFSTKNCKKIILFSLNRKCTRYLTKSIQAIWRVLYIFFIVLFVHFAWRPIRVKPLIGIFHRWRYWFLICIHLKKRNGKQNSINSYFN